MVENTPSIETCDALTPEHLTRGLLGLVVFGPGDGEAMLVKEPDGAYGVVDGCREPKPGDHPHGKGDPVRTFLNQVPGLRRGEAGRLSFVCWTHPHADHFRGLGRRLRAYADRIDRLVLPVDLTGKLGEAWQSLAKHLIDDDDARGLERVVSEVDKFAEAAHGGRDCILRFFGQSANLVQPTLQNGADFSLTSCGPVDLDFQKLLQRMREAGPEGLLESFEIANDPNRLSGALVVRWGNAHILLAGDLLAKETGFHGWSKLHGDIPSPIQVVKVAHHGSEGAYDAKLWDRMKPQLAIVTPFKHASPPQPPKSDDLARIAKAADQVVVTAPPRWPRRLTHTALTTPESKASVHSAVAVSLDANGTITRIVLAGDAAFWG